MPSVAGNLRLYETMCRVLDRLRAEAPSGLTVYHPPSGNSDALVQARSRALLHLYLKARFGLVRFSEREAYITDGKNDGGIDAYFIDRRQKTIYILQAKFRATASNFATSLVSASDLLKMDVGRIVKGEKCNEQGIQYNDKILNSLQKSVRKLTDVGSYTYQVVILGNVKNLSSTQLKKLVDGYTVDQFAHDRIYRELLFPVVSGTYYADPNLTIEINLDNLRGDTHLDYDVKTAALKANVKLVFVPTREIGRIMQTYKNSILKFNPRSFLELQKNRVNQDIEGSIRHTRGNEFAVFNNGITIISEGTKISSDTAKQGTAQIVLRSPQLVNGAQTAYTLARIFEQCTAPKDFAVFRGKEVLLRVITFVGSPKPKGETGRVALVRDISKASNSQTKVEESDRRSNDALQVTLQKDFFDRYGLYYERKRGEFSDGLNAGYIPPALLINRERLVRVALACEFRANQARSSISKFFKENELPKLLKASETAKYAYGYQVLEELSKKKKATPRVKGDPYHTKKFGQALRYGNYAVVAVCSNQAMTACKTESDAVGKALAQWSAFEGWAESLPSNGVYKSGTSFDFVNYYKGSTINADLQKYKVVF